MAPVLAWISVEGQSNGRRRRPVPRAGLPVSVDHPETLAEIQRGLTASTDDEYLRWLVAFLQRELEVSFAFVGELWGEDWDRVRTLAVAGAEGPVDNFDYDLRDTPCANVVGSESACVYPRGVAPQFPDDPLLVDMKVEGYAGLGLFAPSGRPLGLTVLLDTEGISDEVSARAEQLLSAFQGRTQTVLMHRRTLRELKLFESQLDPTDHEDVLAHLARAIAQSLHLRGGFVAEYTDKTRTCLRTLALYLDEVFEPELEWEAAAGAWARDESVGDAIHLRDARARFPDDPFLARTGANTLLMRALRDSKGEPLGYYGAVHDRAVHEHGSDQTLFKLLADRASFELQRRKAEEARRAAERTSLERQRIESLGLLAGGIAHDFNNLLAGMLGCADLALNILDEDNPSRSHIESVVSSAGQAAALCHQMLAYAGRAQSDRTRFNLCRLIEDVTQLVRPSLPTHAQLQLELSPSPIWVEGDRTQLMQVLMNLISNAGEALGDAQGTITVRAELIDAGRNELDGAVPRHKARLEPGAYARVEVRDTGVGMDEETRARIFEPFFTTKTDGHGLGLAAMLGIVQRHRGGVYVRSELGRGSLFTVLLPAAEAESEAQAQTNAKDEAPDESSRTCVLVVDDDPKIRKIVATMLESAGHEVLLAADGGAALERYEQEHARISCVLLDLSMPGLDGRETLARLRELDPAVKVILTSGYSGLDEASELEVDARINKPFRMKQLLRTIAEL